MDCIDIIEKHLKENGLDGLYNSDGDCACTLESGIEPCDNLNIHQCSSGYIQDYTRDGFDYCIGPEKPDGTKKPCPECGQARKFDNDVFESPCSYCDVK